MTDGGDIFTITAASPAAGATALVFASPHSGDRYPEDMGAAPGLSRFSLLKGLRRRFRRPGR